jgi:riboflavin synthase
MFTGIIEALGTVTKDESKGTNKTFWIASPISDQLKIDQSLSHNGVCLTVEEITNGTHRVTAVQETLEKSNLGRLEVGDTINLERCLAMNGRLDGHLVQGHVDSIGTLVTNNNLQGSWELTFSFDPAFANLVIEKGSISLNGISLTVFNVTDFGFSVAVIPYTYEHTNIRNLQPGDSVNLEFDLIGKYIQRNLSLAK